MPKKKPGKAVEIPSKYALYEASVQNAADDAIILRDLYRRIRKTPPIAFREDFCGTFKVACEWVKLGRKNRAFGLDIDREPLNYGFKNHFSKLSNNQKSRLKIHRRNVLRPFSTRVDLIAASNFSYWVFKERRDMVRYFRSVSKSLKRDGLFFVDVVGGTEMIEEHKDTNTFRLGKQKFTYIWRQENFNPITNEGFFSISFKMPRQKEWKQAFTYDWRVWSIQELRECMQEAGFARSWVYWEKDDKYGEGTGEFFRATNAETCPVWIAYIIASKI